MHPKTEIRPVRESVKRTLDAGWVGQTKIHGHRAQIHISAEGEVVAYTRKGGAHKKALSPELKSELLRIYKPAEKWNVIDAEWLKPENKIFVFDFIKKESLLLHALSFEERWELLPHDFISPNLSTLNILRTVDKCMAVLESSEPHVEGLVFKSPRPGFADTSIIRCRRETA